MKNRGLMKCAVGGLAMWMWAAGAMGQATTQPTASAGSATTEPAAVNPALVEGPRLKVGWWMKRHKAVLARVKQGDVDMVFLGDSITQDLEKTRPASQNFLPIWNAFYGDRHAVNMGFSGDLTGHLLWRLDNGEVDGIQPKAAVILIGTNNTWSGRENSEQAIAGVEAVVAKVREKLPATKVLLLAILPSDLADPPGKSATDAAINAALAAQYAGSDMVTFLDVGSVMMKDGKTDWSLYYDPTLPKRNGKAPGPAHPNIEGHWRIAQAMEPTLAKLMGDEPKNVPDPAAVGATTEPAK